MQQKSKISFLLCFVLILILSACKSCDKVIDCPGFPAEQLKLIPRFQFEKTDFTDSSGNTISFFAKNSYSTQGSVRTCRTTFPAPPCDCNENPNANYVAYTDCTTWTKKNTLGTYAVTYKNMYYQVDFRGANKYQITCALLDAEFSFYKDNSVELTGNDQILPNFQIGGKYYKEVIFHQVDTSKNNSVSDPKLREDFVYEMYYTLNDGIIAFRDLKTKRYYYLK